VREYRVSIFTKVGKNEIDHEGEMEVKGVWTKLDKETCKR